MHKRFHLLPSWSRKKVDLDELLQTFAQSLPFRHLLNAARFRYEFAIVRGASFAECSAKFIAGHAGHRLHPKDPAIACAALDLAKKPLKIFKRLVSCRQ